MLDLLKFRITDMALINIVWNNDLLEDVPWKIRKVVY